MKKVTYGEIEAHLKRRTAQYTTVFDDDAARAFRHGWLISAVVDLLNDPESAELTLLKNEIPPWCPPVENVVLPERLTATQVSQRQMESSARTKLREFVKSHWVTLGDLPHPNGLKESGARFNARHFGQQEVLHGTEESQTCALEILEELVKQK